MAHRILLDTNSYLRLAEQLHPLLLTTIPGNEGGELWILGELYKELQSSSRLRNQFSWTFLPEFVENRKTCRWRLRKDQREQIESVTDFALKYSREIGNGASPFDIRCLAFGSVLDCPVVTDDKDMRRLGEALEITVMGTIELLGIMVRSGHCNLQQARNLIRYWIAIDDLPPDHREAFRAQFGEEPPDAPY